MCFCCASAVTPHGPVAENSIICVLILLYMCPHTLHSEQVQLRCTSRESSVRCPRNGRALESRRFRCAQPRQREASQECRGDCKRRRRARYSLYLLLTGTKVQTLTPEELRRARKGCEQAGGGDGASVGAGVHPHACENTH